MNGGESQAGWQQPRDIFLDVPVDRCSHQSGWRVSGIQCKKSGLRQISPGSERGESAGGSLAQQLPLGLSISSLGLLISISNCSLLSRQAPRYI